MNVLAGNSHTSFPLTDAADGVADYESDSDCESIDTYSSGESLHIF